MSLSLSFSLCLEVSSLNAVYGCVLNQVRCCLFCSLGSHLFLFEIHFHLYELGMKNVDPIIRIRFYSITMERMLVHMFILLPLFVVFYHCFLLVDWLSAILLPICRESVDIVWSWNSYNLNIVNACAFLIFLRWYSIRNVLVKHSTYSKVSQM